MIHIIVTGYNCAKYVRSCYYSLLKQSCQEFSAHFISDGSLDDTNNLMKSFSSDDQFSFVHYSENKGAAFRRWEALQSTALQPDDIVCILGMDDELMPDAIKTIKTKYELNRNILMTYGNWIDQHGEGLPHDFELDFPDYIHENRGYRLTTYRATALNTFKKKLLSELTEDDYKVDGKWTDICTETNMVLSCLEMSGRNRIGIVKEKIYYYRKNLPKNTQLKYGQIFKNKIRDQIMSLPKKPLYEDITM